MDHLIQSLNVDFEFSKVLGLYNNTNKEMYGSLFSKKIRAMISSLETLISIFSTFFILMIFIRFIWISSNSKTTKNLPPSPFRLPIIGNLHQLGLAPHRSLKTLAHKHGSLMLIHLGSVPVVVASSAEAAGEIMKTHDVIFSNRPKMTIPYIISYGAKSVGFAPYGEYWRQSKSIYVVHLLSSRKVQMFRRVREDETNLMIDKIQDTLDCVIDLSKILMSLTNDVICEAVLGRKYGDGKFMDQMKELMELLGVFSVGDYVPSLSWVDRLSGLEARARKTAKNLDEFLESVIENRLDMNRNIIGDQSVGCQDIVDILLEIQREQATTNVIAHKDVIKAFILVRKTSKGFIFLVLANLFFFSTSICTIIQILGIYMN